MSNKSGDEPLAPGLAGGDYGFLEDRRILIIKQIAQKFEQLCR